MSHTPFLQVVPQRHETDCCIACLAMLVGVSYEAALLAAGTIAALETRQIQAAARRLGRPLRLKRAVDLENDTGLLAVKSARWKTHHLVVLKDGMVFDTDATSWDADVFIAAYDVTVLSILV